MRVEMPHWTEKGNWMPGEVMQSTRPCQMAQVKMGNTWFPLTRRQCRLTRKSLKVHSIHGAQFEHNNLNYWTALLLLHS